MRKAIKRESNIINAPLNHYDEFIDINQRQSNQIKGEMYCYDEFIDINQQQSNQIKGQMNYWQSVRWICRHKSATKQPSTRRDELLTLTGFIEGPVYGEPATTIATVATEINHILRRGLRGPLRIITRTTKVITKVNTPSAMAPVCKSTFREGPPSMSLYCSGITSFMATTPPTAPNACQTNIHQH